MEEPTPFWFDEPNGVTNCGVGNWGYVNKLDIGAIGHFLSANVVIQDEVTLNMINQLKRTSEERIANENLLALRGWDDGENCLSTEFYNCSLRHFCLSYSEQITNVTTSIRSISEQLLRGIVALDVAADGGGPINPGTIAVLVSRSSEEPSFLSLKVVLTSFGLFSRLQNLAAEYTKVSKDEVWFERKYFAPEFGEESFSVAKADMYSFGMILNDLLAVNWPGDKLDYDEVKYVANKCTLRDATERLSASEALEYFNPNVEVRSAQVSPSNCCPQMLINALDGKDHTAARRIVMRMLRSGIHVSSIVLHINTT